MECSFPQFSLLPAELRCRIWRSAIPRRTVRARLKWDLDAWNGAEEGEWMHIFYGVVPDGRVTALPPVSLVNHEARYEIMKSYNKPLQISRDTVVRSLGGVSVPDSAIDCMTDSSTIPRFDPDHDVLEWTGTGRWGTKEENSPRPLFLAACLSVRHVSIEYDVSMYTQLEVLAVGLLDQDQPLETLTITVKNVEYSIKEGRAQFRLAKHPPGPRLYMKQEQVNWKGIQAALSRHSTCFLPFDYAGLYDDEADFLFKPLPISPGTRLDVGFSIYEVLDPSDLEEEVYISWRLHRGGFLRDVARKAGHGPMGVSI
ncbi:hypothetical protein F4677DRAFT_318319 [Hypoxylon crocopeplum]|nr:hypothetical protein F4677DRAFT_318319 [Hypoxylon crocopeplum]